VSKSYIKGYRFEIRVKRKLEKEGYFVVRSAGSHGPPDLVAIGPLGTIHFIECKVNKDDLTEEERKKLEELAMRYSAKAWLAFREGRKVKFWKIA